MKKILLAGTALLAIMSSASAADLGARPYTKAPAMVSPGMDWSGFYIGAMGGYGWSTGSDSSDLRGGFGGGTIGYNWQMPGSQFVVGIEADAAAAGISASATAAGITVEDRINALGSVTGRLGLAASSALFYVKGGYAWADNKVSVAVGPLSLSDSRVHSGWTLGAGVEYMFAPSWSAKAEYMYADFGSANFFGNIIPGGIDSGNQQLHTIKGGINYHFNWGGPAVARY